MMMRLIKCVEGAEYTAKVYRNYHWDEYVVKYYKNGKYMGEGPTYYTDAKDDALHTASYQVMRYESK
jgi:hypothetical protein